MHHLQSGLDTAKSAVEFSPAEGHSWGAEASSAKLPNSDDFKPNPCARSPSASVPLHLCPCLCLCPCLSSASATFACARRAMPAAYHPKSTGSPLPSSARFASKRILTHADPPLRAPPSPYNTVCRYASKRTDVTEAHALHDQSERLLHDLVTRFPTMQAPAAGRMRHSGTEIAVGSAIGDGAAKKRESATQSGVGERAANRQRVA